MDGHRILRTLSRMRSSSRTRCPTAAGVSETASAALVLDTAGFSELRGAITGNGGVYGGVRPQLTSHPRDLTGPGVKARAKSPVSARANAPSANGLRSTPDLALYRTSSGDTEGPRRDQRRRVVSSGKVPMKMMVGGPDKREGWLAIPSRKLRGRSEEPVQSLVAGRAKRPEARRAVQKGLDWLEAKTTGPAASQSGEAPPTRRRHLRRSGTTAPSAAARAHGGADGPSRRCRAAHLGVAVHVQCGDRNHAQRGAGTGRAA